MTPLLAVDDVDTAALLCDDLAVEECETVHAVHAFAPDATSVARRDGEEALNVVRSRLGARATVRLHRPEGDPVAAVTRMAAETGADVVVVGTGALAEAVAAEVPELRAV